ncbi:MAG: hypothetical protein NZ518_09885, partial [Dehalococcoidia bacterium]|nr:hypothetical protein [Dehalococcoidia bacterium]
LARGLADALPYVADARPIDILWGFDAHVKSLRVSEPFPNVIAANCGSAVRVSALIGAELADRLLVGIASSPEPATP